MIKKFVGILILATALIACGQKQDFPCSEYPNQDHCKNSTVRDCPATSGGGLSHNEHPGEDCV